MPDLSAPGSSRWAVPEESGPWLAAAGAFAAVLLLAALLRCWNLGAASLWTDELFTALYPKSGLGYIWTDGLRTEPTSPFYYTLIWGIERLFGDGPWALRLPSVFGSLLGIGLAALLARELSEEPAAPLLAALLLALAPTNIFFAQEARTYALQGAALTMALLGFARCLRHGPSVGSLAIYVVGATLAIYLHPTSLLAVAAINVVALLCAAGRNRLLGVRELIDWFAASVLVAVLCLPILPTLLSPSAASAVSWIPPLSRWSLEGVVGLTLAGPAAGDRAMSAAEILLPLAAALLLLPPWRLGWDAVAVLLLVPGLFLALMIGISVKTPLLLPRTLAWLLLPLAVLLGDVLARWLKTFAPAVILAVAAGTVIQFAQADRLKEDWRGFLARLPDFAPPSLIVLAPHTSPAAIERYAPAAGEPVRMEDPGPATAETLLTTRVFAPKTLTPAELRAAIESGRPVWLIYRRPEYQWMLKATAGLPPPNEAVQDVEGSNPGMRALFWRKS